MPETEVTAAAAAPIPRKGRRVMALLAGLTVTGAAAAAVHLWMGSAAGPEPAQAPRKPLFVPLEPFTVNLQEPRGDRFAQIGVTLEYDDPQVETRIKDHLPALRNNILVLLSSKRVDELLTSEGKAQLAAEIRVRAGQALGYEPSGSASAAKRGGPNPVRGVLFSQFIVQ